MSTQKSCRIRVYLLQLICQQGRSHGWHGRSRLPPRQMPVPPSSLTKFTKIWLGISRRCKPNVYSSNAVHTLYTYVGLHTIMLSLIASDRLSDSTPYSLRALYKLTPLDVHGAQLLSIERLHISSVCTQIGCIMCGGQIIETPPAVRPRRQPEQTRSHAHLAGPCVRDRPLLFLILYIKYIDDAACSRPNLLKCADDTKVGYLM